MYATGVLEGAKTRRIARTLIVLSVLFLMSSIGMRLTLAASPFTLSIDTPVTMVGTTVTITGVADSPAGEQSGNYVIINWGDGSTPTQLANFAGSGPWAWGPESHTYADGGAYTITATLYHAKQSGQDQSSATDSTGVVVPDPGCESDCGGGTTGGTTGDTTTGGTTGDSTTGGTAGDSTTGGTTGDSTTGGTTGDTTTGGTTGDTTTTTGGTENGTTTGTPVVGGSNDGPEVLGKTVTRKPLATTGNETTVLAVLGFALLMLGSALRFGRFGTRVAMATASPADELVTRSLALIERTVRPSSRDWYCH